MSERFRDAEYDRDAVRSNLGLSPEDRAVLVVAGSWGVGDVVATVEAIGRSGEFHPITVCGRDDNLRAELESRGFGTVIGWTDEMPALDVGGRRAGRERRWPHVHGGVRGRAAGDHVPAHRRARQGQRRDDGPRRGQLLRARRRRAARRSCARSPGRVRSATRSSTPPGCLFVADPADDVEELAQTEHLVDRKGRVVALRAPRGRRTAMIAAASVLVLYGGLTLGAQAVSAIGVGVAKPPKNADRHRLRRRPPRPHAAHRRRAARRDPQPGRVGGRRRPAPRRTARSSSSSSPTRASTSPTAAGARARSCAGTGPATTSPRPGKLIAQEAGQPAREFCPGRRLDAFDQYYSHRQKQKLVRANHTVRPESLPTQLESGKVYVLDGRDRDPTAMEVAVADLEAQFEPRRPARRAARGAALSRRAPLKYVGAAGLAGAGALAVVHAAPALGGVSPIGVRFTPALVGVGRRGHVALTFDDGPDAASTPQFLDALDALGLARDVLHARRDDASRPRRSRARSPTPGTRSRCTATCTATCCAARPRHAADDIARAVRHRRRRDRRRAALVPPSVRHLVVRVVARRARGSG